MPHPSQIAISDYTYDLPQEKIAAYPLENRHASKLLDYKNETIEEFVFRDLTDVLPEHAVLVFNKTRVIQARLHFFTEKSQAIEIFCLEPHEPHEDLTVAMAKQLSCRWNCLVGNLKRWKENELILKKGDISLKASIVERFETHVVIDFSWEPKELCFAEVLSALGNMPIPPYLKRKSELKDSERYQTIYAEAEGSVAAPTAGLHFTEEVMQSLDKKGIERLSLTLHVGAGTFKPVKSEKLKDHSMHAEWLEVEKSMIEKLVKCKDKTIVAVGTTSLRSLESLYWMGLKVYLNPESHLEEIEIKQWEVYELEQSSIPLEASLGALLSWMEARSLEKLICQTQILIAPPYQLKVAKGLVTNFHQPQSTLLLLVSAIVGDKWKSIYQYALDHEFRFLSYGDSSLLLK